MPRWLIWILYVVLWTIALEVPVPQTDSLPGGQILVTRKYLVAKSLHVAAYATMTILAAWMMAPPRYRWLLMLFLMVHATGTELLQEALHEWCGRGGSLDDVAFDQLGILLGAAASWKWWMREA